MILGTALTSLSIKQENLWPTFFIQRF